jgi:hypothetical protein
MRGEHLEVWIRDLDGEMESLETAVDHGGHEGHLLPVGADFDARIIGCRLDQAGTGRQRDGDGHVHHRQVVGAIQSQCVADLPGIGGCGE